MSEKRFKYHYNSGEDWITDNNDSDFKIDLLSDCGEQIVALLNNQYETIQELESDLKECRRLKKKRLNKIRNHRAVIEDMGGSIRAYKGKLSQLNLKIEKIEEEMDDTGALTKRQLEEILND